MWIETSIILFLLKDEVLMLEPGSYGQFLNISVPTIVVATYFKLTKLLLQVIVKEWFLYENRYTMYQQVI